MTKRLALIAALLFCARFVFAGDVATFVNLGFSPDAHYYLFAEYGVTGSSKPYASIYGVNVAENSFLPDGVRERSYDAILQPGQDGFGAFLTLFSSYVPISAKYHIDHLLIGRELYLLVDGAQPQGQLTFRDFVGDSDYTVLLNQTSYGSGKSVSSSYYIDLTIKTKSGRTLHYVVGHPDLKRNGVENYRIRRILMGPDNKSLVFVIEKHELDASGYNVRFMVETVHTDL
ncbi:MAG TPA: DUF2259 domain-containing protein [Spirochaetia bacterium]|nr:DUF2259 domain-containing protein [Spirochaetia bacterium]HUZ18806.1 DUF2259 domain-containing protein [Spirochaetia bacterium]